jgi:hypothetical protein
MTGVTPGQAERERFAAKMEMLAGWLDADDFAKGRAGRTEVQEDLRRWAAAARDLAAQEPPAAPGEVVHLSPRDATYVTPCCGQTPFELARTDRMTNDPPLVTCGGPEMKPAPEMAAQPGLRVDWARVSEAVADRERERDEARAERDALHERAEAAEAEKRQAKGDLAGLEDRLAKVIAAAVMAEQARAEAAETEAARLRDLLAEQERAAGMDAEYMAPRDAARVLRVDPTTLVTFESAGKLTTVRTPWGHRRYRTADVKALRREREARRG